MGFKPTHANYIGRAVQHLNNSASLSEERGIRLFIVLNQKNFEAKMLRFK